jgi:sialic acid synthase SpsE
VKVIAEVGSNWKSLQDCVESIRMAKEAGADAVKFQYFTGPELYGKDIKRSNTPDVVFLHKMCARTGIEFMCTAFSPYGYRFIDPYVKCHKIASSEITAFDLLDTVNNFKRPVYLSTGGAKVSQIIEALNHLKDCEVTLMYCVAEYPAKIIDFRLLQTLQYLFGPKVKYGYSDHSIDVLVIPERAKDLGAVVIEKHVNFTKHTDTPDAPHSLNYDEFKLMIKHLKTGVSAQETFRPNPHQRKIITLANGSIGYFRPSADE